MNYTEKEKEHLIHSFDLFCKRVIKNKAYEIYNRNKRYNERFVSLDKVYNEYLSECGVLDTYPILQYHFKAFGYVFSVNDYKLGNALLKLEKSKRDIILMYYFTDLNLSDLACFIGYSNRTASYRHIQGLHLLRELMEADNE